MEKNSSHYKKCDLTYLRGTTKFPSSKISGLGFGGRRHGHGVVVSLPWHSYGIAMTSSR